MKSTAPALSEVSLEHTDEPTQCDTGTDDVEKTEPVAPVVEPVGEQETVGTTAQTSAIERPEPQQSETEKQQLERASAVRGMPVSRLADRHTEQCRLLPDRLRLLERLPRNAIAAEIGAAFGDFTAEIMQRARPTQLHLIDAWSTDRYKAGLERIRDARAVDLRDGRLVINQGTSVEVMASYSDNFFDWVYIDTNHTYETTLEELRIAARIVRPSGRIAGHDHCTGNVIKPFPYGVIQAVCQFCVEAEWGYEYLTAESHGHASFCLIKL